MCRMVKTLKDSEITDLFSKAGRILSHSRETEGKSRVSTITFEQLFAVQRIFDRVGPDGYWYPAEWRDWLPAGNGNRSLRSKWARIGKVSIRRVGEPPPSPGHTTHRALGSTGFDEKRSMITKRAMEAASRASAKHSSLHPTQQSRTIPASSSTATHSASSLALASPMSTPVPEQQQKTNLHEAPLATRQAETSKSKTAVTVSAASAQAGPSKQSSPLVHKITGQSKQSSPTIASQTQVQISPTELNRQLSPSGTPLLPGTTATAMVSSRALSERGQCYLHVSSIASGMLI